MARITCTRILAFDAAHRVVGHEGKCKHLHGHRYNVEVTCEAAELDRIGRVIDFAVIKQKLGRWLEGHWDHTAILWAEDERLTQAITAITSQAIYRLPWNPTAENMARYLAERICPTLFADDGIRCVNVRVQETPNCYADYTP